jgi:membrane glycosyltransferase
MDPVNKSRPLAPSADMASEGFLPAESTLPMMPCRLDQPAETERRPARTETALALRRLFILIGTALLTAAGGYEMYDVLKVGGVTVLEGILLAFFLLLLAWIAFSFMSALAGSCVLLAQRQTGLRIDSERLLPDITSRTAMLLPIYSLMAGDAIVRLVHAMEANPTAALVQTQPVIVNARSLFGRLQQFAGRVYGPIIAAGNAWWHGPESNYWGHNAIIRVRAFAQEAGLPELRGRKPFGGHILSHDFVEAALMRRAGWAIYTAPSLGGSFEEVPPSILDFAARDRRWCQGNLQHIAVLPARGLHWVSRLHLMTGIGSYLTAPIWFIFLLLGLLISLQAHFVRPEYFPKGFSLFPTWPAQDPVLAAWVFAATMGLLIVPKLLAYLVLISRRKERVLFGGSIRVLAGILAETVLAAMIAPSMMIFQSSAVAEILLGRDAGWEVQRRSDGEVARGEIYRKLTAPTLFGLVLGLSAYAVSIPLLLWMSPVVVGLVLTLPLGLLTSSRLKTAGLFATPEDNCPPPVLVRAKELAASARIEMTGALQQLRQDTGLLNYHLVSLSHVSRPKLGWIDVPLATARAKIEECTSFEEAVAWLDRQESRAVLNNPVILRRILQMPNSHQSAQLSTENGLP